MNSLFFELIQVSLHKRDCLSHIPLPEEWSILYRLAEGQALVGVCFHGIQLLEEQKQLIYIPASLKMQWIASLLRGGQEAKQSWWYCG